MPGQSYHTIIVAEVPTDTSRVEGTLRHQDLRLSLLCLSFCQNSRSHKANYENDPYFELQISWASSLAEERFGSRNYSSVLIAPRTGSLCFLV